MNKLIWQRGTKAFPVFALILCGFTARGAEQAEWQVDWELAQAKAKAEHRLILLDFTGSDWCGWCMKLQAEVFSQPEFVQFAREHLVLVELDFPHNKAMNPLLVAQNAELAEKFKVHGYPTIILLDSQNNKLGELVGYLRGGLPAYINWMKRQAKLGDPGEIPHAKSATVAKELPGAGKAAPAASAAPVVSAAPTVEYHYGALALKAISGGKERRMAMINNKIFLAGETSKVKTQDQKVEVCCKEIREDSVLITADGKLMELKLANH